MLTKHILSLKIKQSQFAYLKEKYLPLRVLQVFSCRNPSPWTDCCPYAWLTLVWGVSADKCGVYRTFCVRLHIEKSFWPHDVVLLTYGQNKLLGKIKGKKLIVACIYIYKVARDRKVGGFFHLSIQLPITAILSYNHKKTHNIFPGTLMCYNWTLKVGEFLKSSL